MTPFFEMNGIGLKALQELDDPGQQVEEDSAVAANIDEASLRSLL